MSTEGICKYLPDSL